MKTPQIFLGRFRYARGEPEKKKHFVLRKETLRFIFWNISFCGLYMSEKEDYKHRNPYCGKAVLTAEHFVWDR